MLVVIRRFSEFGKGGTVGWVKLDGWECWSLEAPWLDNVRFQSCVPAGLYELVPHDGKRYQRTYALVKDGEVSHWEEPGVPRYTCVFHASPFATGLKGCVCLAMSLDQQSGMPRAGLRGLAHRHLLEMLKYPQLGHECLIEDAYGGWKADAIKAKSNADGQ